MRCIIMTKRKLTQRQYRTIKSKLEEVMYAYNLDCVCIGTQSISSS